MVQMLKLLKQWNAHVLVSVLMLIVFDARSQTVDSVVVKLNTTDCKFCYSGFYHFKPLNVKKITLVTRANQENVCNKYSKDYLKQFEIATITSDSVYTTLSNSLSSEVYLYNHGDLVYNNLLKNFQADISLNVSVDTITKIPANYAFSGFAKVKEYNLNFLIYDSYHSKSILYNPKKGTFKSYDFNSVDYGELLLAKGVIDSSGKSLYDLHSQKMVKQLNLDKVSLYDPTFADSVAAYFSVFYIPVKAPNSDKAIAISPTSAVFLYNFLQDSIVNYYSVPNLIEIDGDSIAFFQSPQLFNDTSIFLIGHKKHESDTLVFCTFDTSEPGKIREWNYGKLPDYYVQTGFFYTLSIPITRPPYFMFPLCGDIYSAKEKCVIGRLPYKNPLNAMKKLTEGNPGFRFYLIDYFIDGDDMYILHYNSNSKFSVLTRFNLKTRRMVFVKPANIPPFIGVHSLTFTKKDQLCGLDLKKTMVVKLNITY
jgi:hypothetical protein